MLKHEQGIARDTMSRSPGFEEDVYACNWPYISWGILVFLSDLPAAVDNRLGDVLVLLVGGCQLVANENALSAKCLLLSWDCLLSGL